MARLMGEGAAMRQLRSMIVRLAHSMAPVAIFGESGSARSWWRGRFTTHPRAARCRLLPSTVARS